MHTTATATGAITYNATPTTTAAFTTSTATTTTVILRHFSRTIRECRPSVLITIDLHFTLSIASCLVIPTTLISSTLQDFPPNLPWCPAFYFFNCIQLDTFLDPLPSHLSRLYMFKPLNLPFSNIDCMPSKKSHFLSQFYVSYFFQLAPSYPSYRFHVIPFQLYVIDSIERPRLTFMQLTAPKPCIAHFPSLQMIGFF